MITLDRFRRLEAAVRAAGYGDTIEWAERLAPPADADAFARIAIYVICNAGLRSALAIEIAHRCVAALEAGSPAASVFGHPGKAMAIDAVWRDRDALWAAYQAADDKLLFAATLPWVGPVTKYHLVKNLGLDTAKADVHLSRLARRESVTPLALCTRLAAQTGYRIATVDTILWRACESGILDSRAYELFGWRAAFRG